MGKKVTKKEEPKKVSKSKTAVVEKSSKKEIKDKVSNAKKEQQTKTKDVKQDKNSNNKKIEAKKDIKKETKKETSKKTNEPKKETKTTTATTTTKSNNKSSVPPPTKKQSKKVESDDSDDDDDVVMSEEEGSEEEIVPSSDEDQDESDFEEIQADFDINPCGEADYHSIKNMINRLVPYNANIEFVAGDVTDLIIEQAKKKKFGRCIRVEGSEDPYGFYSILNHNTYKSNASIKGYLDYIKLKLDSAESSYIDKKLFKKDSSISSVFTNILGNSKKEEVGLIFSERFLNIPNQLVHPLYQFIQYDIELLNESNQKGFDFKHYIVFSSFGITTKPNEEEEEAPPPAIAAALKQSGGAVGKKDKKNQAKIVEESQQPQVEEGLEVYQKIEDKYFKQYASAWAIFNIPYEYGKGSKWTLYSNLNRKGLVMLIPATKIQNFLTDLKEKAIFE
ncbi:hypothetical protein CYY_001576 [Polysphondylium violaceum]|uniref:Uncharacterized protein n=1 Tax=Polysphondylium violaceum TaxID=133409 RepID=A0A8J4VAH0_9MYCE|nr:hypothetical protein CYY_001576 [Polysphondylium violaceum]